MPGAMPVTTPDEVSTEAVVVLLLVQLPPGNVWVNNMLYPVATLAAPEIVPAFAEEFTVTVVTDVHPAEIWYVTIAVPGLTGDTTHVPPPTPVTVAELPLLLVHVPPVTAQLNVDGLPMQILGDPNIAPGARLTVR